MGFLTFILGLLILIIVLKILTFPIKLIAKFIINLIIGGILLFFCAFIGIKIFVTWWSLLLVGLLGIPGFALALVIGFFI